MLGLVRLAIAGMLRILVPVAITLALLIPFFIAASDWWTSQNEAHRLSMLPSGLRVEKIIDYAFTGDQTPLPSANSNGLIVYLLPAAIAERIASGGVAELQRLLQDHAVEEEEFRSWQATPIKSARAFEWLSGGPDPTADHFVPHNWVPTDAELARSASYLLRQKGNFYSFDHHSRRLIIVAPLAGLVVLAFSE